MLLERFTRGKFISDLILLHLNILLSRQLRVRDSNFNLLIFIVYNTIFGYSYRTDLASQSELKAFLEESLLMKDFQHPNILGLTGVCFDTLDGVPFIILPFMANGSLKDYLKSKRTHITNVNTLPEVCHLSTSILS